MLSIKNLKSYFRNYFGSNTKNITTKHAKSAKSAKMGMLIIIIFSKISAFQADLLNLV